MPVTKETSDLYNNLRSDADDFSTKVKLRHLEPKEDRATGGGSDFNIDIRGTLTAVSGSTTDKQHIGTSYDVFLLSWNLSFTPDSGQDIAMYSIMLRALQDENTAFSEFTKDSEAWSNYRGGDDDFSFNRWSWNDPPTLNGSVWYSTEPKNLDNSTSYTVSSSYSFGVNAGFFGGTPTGGIDANHTASTSQTCNVVSMKIVNNSTSDLLQIHFVPHQFKSNDIDLVVNGVLKIPDDGKGQRSNSDSDESTARKVAIELLVIVIPKDQMMEKRKLVSDAPIFGDRLGRPFPIYETSKWQAYHLLRRRIHLRLPPVAR